MQIIRTTAMNALLCRVSDTRIVGPDIHQRITLLDCQSCQSVAAALGSVCGGGQLPALARVAPERSFRSPLSLPPLVSGGPPRPPSPKPSCISLIRSSINVDVLRLEYPVSSCTHLWSFLVCNNTCKCGSHVHLSLSRVQIKYLDCRCNGGHARYSHKICNEITPVKIKVNTEDPCTPYTRKNN